jgi:hypothetical protein
MSAARRSVAALLALWLGLAPAAQAAGLKQAPPPSVALPSASLSASGVKTAAPAYSAAAAFPVSKIAAPVLPASIVAATAKLPAAATASPALKPSSGASSSRQPVAQASLPQLKLAADVKLPSAAASVFDGSGKTAASSQVSGSASAGRALAAASAHDQQPGKAGPPAPEKKKSWLKRFHEATRPATAAEKWFERLWLYGAAAGTLVPVLWQAAPFHSLAVTLPLAVILPVVFTGILTMVRAARFIFTGKGHSISKPSSRLGLGIAVAVGLSLAAFNSHAPTHFKPEIVEHIEHRLTGSNPATAVRGGHLDSAVIETLSANPVGRDILNQLRDRSGTIRLPDFFVRKEKTAIASHSPFFDAVYIGEAEITSRGWTVQQFLDDPEKQALLVRQYPSVFAHELTHAAQARRHILEPGQFHNSMEYEYEAYMAEHFYIHEQLKMEPGTVIEGMGSYEVALEDVEAFLKNLDSDTSYKENTHIDSPRYRKWKADLMAGWPAHQIEAWALLAQRRKDSPYYLKYYRQHAAAVAAEHKLPLPPILQAPAEKK